MTDHASPQHFQRILTLVHQGKLDEAALIAEQTRQNFTDDNRLGALLGAIEIQRGNFARSAALLEPVQAATPSDGVVRANLAEALYHTGQVERALGLCDPASIEQDRTGRLVRLAAFFAQEAGQYQRAADHYRTIVSAHRDDWSSWNNLGNALGALGDTSGAVEALETAASFASDSGPIQINLANAYFADGQAQKAEELLRRMAEADPTDPKPLTTLFAIYRRQGREDDSYAAIRDAAQRAPADAEIRSDYGQEAAKRNDYGIAEVEFEAALQQDPQLGPAIVGLASMYERMNREDELPDLKLRAEASKVEAQSVAYIEAMIQRRAGDFEAALQALDASGEVVAAGRRFHLRGILLDRLGRHDEAFAAFQAMNDYWLADPSFPLPSTTID